MGLLNRKLCTRGRISFLLLTALLGLAAGCSLQEPVLPTWLTEIYLPLEPQHFQVVEELDSSVIAIQPGDSVLLLSIEGEVDPFSLNREDLVLSPQDSSRVFTLDTLRFDSLKALESGFHSLRELMPQLAASVNQVVVIPETSFVAGPFLLFSQDFHALLLDKGILQLELVNDLPFPFGPNSSTPQGITVTVINDSTGELVSELNSSRIVQPGEVLLLSDTVQGKWLYSPLRLEAVVPVAQPTTVLITDSLLDSSGTSLRLQLSQVLAREAIARIEPQHYRRVFRIRLRDRKGNRLRNGSIQEGRLYITLTNQVPLSGNLVLQVPEFRNPAMEPLTITAPFLAHQTVEAPPVILDQMTIQNIEAPTSWLDSVKILLDLSTRASNGFVHVRAGDQFRVRVQTDSIYFGFFSGYLAPDSLRIPTFRRETPVDYGGLDNNIRFSAAELLLNIFSTIAAETLIVKRLDIVGYHQTDEGEVTDTATIQIRDFIIQSGVPDNPALSQLILPATQVTPFLNILPTHIEGSGLVRYGGGVEVELQRSAIWAKYRFSTPITIRVEDTLRVEGEVQTVTEEDLDEEFRQSAGQDVPSAATQLIVTNHTPLQGQITMLVTRDSTRLRGDFFDLSQIDPAQEFVEIIAIPSATLDPQAGYVVQSGEQENFIQLTREEISLFQQPPLYVGFLLHIHPTPGEVTLRASDFIELRGKAVFQVRVKR